MCTHWRVDSIDNCVRSYMCDYDLCSIRPVDEMYRKFYKASLTWANWISIQNPIVHSTYVCLYDLPLGLVRLFVTFCRFPTKGGAVGRGMASRAKRSSTKRSQILWIFVVVFVVKCSTLFLYKLFKLRNCICALWSCVTTLQAS